MSLDTKKSVMLDDLTVEEEIWSDRDVILLVNAENTPYVYACKQEYFKKDRN